MHILIIGGTRHLGPAIVRELLARGHQATVLHRGSTACDLPEGVEEIIADARDPEAMEGILREGGYDGVVDTILHAADLAWLLPLAQRYTDQLVHCGSTGVYTPMVDGPVCEDDPTPCPAELGGFGEKLAQDRQVLDFHTATGFKVCSLRISNVFGAGDVPIDIWGSRNPAYFQRIADGKPIWVPLDGSTLLQPVHVDDLARGFCAALARECASGQIYNLSSERAVTLTEYVEMSKQMLHSESSIEYVPPEQILATGKANAAGLRFLCEDMSIDWGKAQQEIGYTPRISVEQGLRDSLGWMVAQKILRLQGDTV